MKKIVVIILLLIFLSSTTLLYIPFAAREPGANDQSSDKTGKTQNIEGNANESAISPPLTTITMHITSAAFQNNQNIPSKYTCDGENISPPLEIAGVPENARTLAIIVHDPDAPAGDWVHWTAWNIPPETTLIPENTKPEGTEGTTDFGRTGWGGPCPPSGTHRYFYVLYALDTDLNLPETSKRSDLEKAMEGHILAKSELVGLYTRG